MPLTHYIVVRRDLPFGILAAQIAHAAGESFYAFALPKITVSNRTMAGSMPGPGTMMMASGGYLPPNRYPGDRAHERRVPTQTFTIPSSSPFVASSRTAGTGSGSVQSSPS